MIRVSDRKVQSFAPSEEFSHHPQREHVQETHVYQPSRYDRLPDELPYSRATVIFENGENFVQYGKLEVLNNTKVTRNAQGVETTITDMSKPGIVWTGWSTYGAGAGFDGTDGNAKSNQSTDRHNQRMKELFW